MQLSVFTDGGARGNPGPAAIGVVLTLGEKEQTIERCIGSATNNIAEYTAVLDALAVIPRWVEENTVSSVAFYLDSELVVKQLQGLYRVKEPTLQTLHSRVKEQLAELSIPFTFTHIPRAQNKQADALVNHALDTAHV